MGTEYTTWASLQFFSQEETAINPVAKKSCGDLFSISYRNLSSKPLFNQDITGLTGKAARDKPPSGKKPGRDVLLIFEASG